jgi:hypothetical protein
MHLVQWFRRTFDEDIIFSIPNGGGRTISQGALLKATGVLKGVPDLFVPSKKLFIEVKTEKGKLSDDQKTIILKLTNYCYRCVVCYGLEDCIKQTEELMNE